MKYLYMIIIISMLMVSGCSDNESRNELKLETEQLKQETERLLVEKEELVLDLKIVNAESARKNDLLNNEISSLQADNESQNEIINRYQKAFEFSISNMNTIADTLSIFSPVDIKKGHKIAGLIVSNITTGTANESTSYHVKFTGEFEVKGSIVHNVFGGSQYSFIVKENLEKIPHRLEEFEKGSVYFDIEDSEELKKVLGDKLEGLPEDGELEIVGVFKNYSFNYVPETDSFPSFAEFVRLKSEN